jgi:predicted amidohydrolase YtcJ
MCRRSAQNIDDEMLRILLAAIRIHTLDAAAANFEEQVKGSLTPGKLADMVLLSENPFSVDCAYIKDVEVVMTVLGGRVIRDSRFEIDCFLISNLESQISNHFVGFSKQR